MKADYTAQLPSGEFFRSWEKECRWDRELHVDCENPKASDSNGGTKDKPFKTIQGAADIAKAGTKVLIHGGTYRECVRPAHGGESPEYMVAYEAFGDGDVIIKASEIASSFKPSTGWQLNRFDRKADVSHIKVWELALDGDIFKGYNPFGMVNILHDRLYIEYAKTDMTTYLNRRGMIFCDGKPLTQVSLYQHMAETEASYWVEANGMKVHFRLPEDSDPENHLIEISCREQCFAPEKHFLSYIKLKGLVCAHAATGAPVPQRGAISCSRGHHWIFEDCVVDWSNAVGIDIGNECWHHSWQDKPELGYTIIRRCKIYDVGVCAIAGMFVGNLLIEDNLIQGTGWQKMELSWEAGGMKVHGCRNSLIRRNIFTKTIRADHLWMDVGNENNRITQNLFLDGIEQREAIFIECSKDGVNLIDNNIIWNVEGRFDQKELGEKPGSSGWYAFEEDGIVNGWAIYGEGTDYSHISNNLIGKCRSAGYFAKQVAFRIGGGGRGGTSRDINIYNNIFYDCGEAAIKFPTEKNKADGNMYVKMPGGYLRVLYPAPAACLDLPAWQKFYGFDIQGQEGWFDIKVDTDNFRLEFVESEDKPVFFPGREEKDPYVYGIEKANKVNSDPLSPTDFFGNEANSETRIPGPFSEAETAMVYSIDPRKLT